MALAMVIPPGLLEVSATGRFYCWPKRWRREVAAVTRRVGGEKAVFATGQLSECGFNSGSGCGRNLGRLSLVMRARCMRMVTSSKRGRAAPATPGRYGGGRYVCTDQNSVC